MAMPCSPWWSQSAVAVPEVLVGSWWGFQGSHAHSDPHPSLQGALQLRRDFEAVRELVCSESSGLAPEARQALQALCVFRHTDTAVRCLLQQPGGLGGPPRGWGSLRRCCESGVGWE